MRGDLYRVRLPKGVGHEQQGPRYAVIVQSERLHLSTVLVAPTSTARRATRYRPEVLIDGVRTRVLVEQVSALDLDRLGEFAGRLGPVEMAEVDAALRLALGLL